MQSGRLRLISLLEEAKPHLIPSLIVSIPASFWTHTLQIIQTELIKLLTVAQAN